MNLSNDIIVVLKEKLVRDLALIARCKPISEYEISVAPPADDMVLTIEEHLDAAQRRAAAIKARLNADA